MKSPSFLRKFPAIAGTPFGTAWLPESGTGVNLDGYSYIEEEHLVSGVAHEWSYDAQGQATSVAAHPYTTRILVRRPADTCIASGAVHLEPLHPNLDAAPTWDRLFPWLMRRGHTWVGVTQDYSVARQLRDAFPERYGSLSLPASGLGYDIVGQLATALHSGTVPGINANRVILSGWSATGSFCRVYLQDGFHQRHRLPDGGPAVDGVAIGISSGAAGSAGYPPLSAACPALAADDVRRTIRGCDIPVIEILSELESETHGSSLREDGDAADDRYRLYQIAGTSHDTLSESYLTNTVQFERVGGSVPGRRIAEEPSDAKMEYISRALFEWLDQWITEGRQPPHAARFSFERMPIPRNVATALARDALGNVIGGIRPPWIAVPLSTYRPHSTPAQGSCQPPEWVPMGSPEQVAALIGNALPFPNEVVSSLYGSREDYLMQFEAATHALQEQGWLLPPEGEELIATAGERWEAHLRSAR